MRKLMMMLLMVTALPLSACGPDTPYGIVRQTPEALRDYTDYALCKTMRAYRGSELAIHVRREIIRRGLASEQALERAEKGYIWPGANGCLWLIGWGEPDRLGRCGEMIYSGRRVYAWYDEDCSYGPEALVVLDAPGEMNPNLPEWRIINITRRR